MKDKCFNYGFESHSKVQYVYNTLLEKVFLMFLKPADLWVTNANCFETHLHPSLCFSCLKVSMLPAALVASCAAGNIITKPVQYFQKQHGSRYDINFITWYHLTESERQVVVCDAANFCIDLIPNKYAADT